MNRLNLSILALAVLLVGGTCDPAAAKTVEHPTLVSVESAQCDLCHEDLTEGKPLIHAPAEDDCTLCHEFSKDESGTTTEMADAEPALCVMCHDELEKAADLDLETPHMPVGDSCLTCHDAHASDQPHLLLGAVKELCGECHEVDDLNEAHGGQLTDATNCASCHLPHGSDNDRMLIATRHHAPFADGSCTGCHREPFGTRIRLRSRGERLCLACHGEFDKTEGGSVHAALKGDRGRAGCLSCHAPHMSAQRALLVKSDPQVCAECHQSIVEATQAETGHAAAEECMNCHLPHTAEQAHLLTMPGDELCGDCHDLNDADLAASHLGADLSALSCTQCHSPHGAGHAKLLAANLHAPIEDGCDTCHEGAFDELAEGGGAELCLMCHDEIGEAASAATVPHAALELDGCTACHNPHASAQPSLVKLPSGAACGECHDEQMAGPDEVTHGIIDLVGCEACHKPHGGENSMLLRMEVASDLCLSCHGPGSVQVDAEDSSVVTFLERFPVPAERALAAASLRLSDDNSLGHPIGDHRVLGTPTDEEMDNTDSEFSAEFTCLTCHDPHKGRSAGLFQWGVASTFELCQHCHLK